MGVCLSPSGIFGFRFNYPTPYLQSIVIDKPCHNSHSIFPSVIVVRRLIPSAHTCCYEPRTLENKFPLGPIDHIHRFRAPTLRDHTMLSPFLTTIPPHELSPSLCCPFLRYHILCSLLQIVIRGGTLEKCFYLHVWRSLAAWDLGDF